MLSGILREEGAALLYNNIIPYHFYGQTARTDSPR